MSPGNPWHSADDRALVLRCARGELDGDDAMELVRQARRALAQGLDDPELEAALAEGDRLEPSTERPQAKSTGRYAGIRRDPWRELAGLHDLGHIDQYVLLSLCVEADHRTATWPRLTERRQATPRPGRLDDLAGLLRLRRQTLTGSLRRLADLGVLRVESSRSGRRQGTLITVLAYPLVVHLGEHERQRVQAAIDGTVRAAHTPEDSSAASETENTSAEPSNAQTSEAPGPDGPKRTTPREANGPNRTSRRAETHNTNGPKRTTAPDTTPPSEPPTDVDDSAVDLLLEAFPGAVLYQLVPDGCGGIRQEPCPDCDVTDGEDRDGIDSGYIERLAATDAPPDLEAATA